MAFERKWAAISPRNFTQDGTTSGIITLATTSKFKVKQQITIGSNTQPAISLEVKRVLSSTTMMVGPLNTPITSFSDISAFTVADSAVVSAPEQPRPSIPDKEYERASYEEEPTVAKRTFLVDEFGNKYATDNPFPVELSDGSVNIGTVNAELEVQLSARDNDPDAGDVHDSVRIGDQNHELKINPDQSINVNTYEKMFELLVNANFLKLANYDQVIPTFSGDTATLSYYESQAKIAQAQIRFVSSTDWDMSLEAYLNNDNGDILQDDNGDSLLLE